MLRASNKISDLFFSPGKPPMIEVNGRLNATGPRALSADDTRKIATDLIGDNKHALATLREQGSCDVSYSLPGASRFRVNVFMQRGSCAIVMRVIPGAVPDFAALALPAELEQIVNLRSGIVLVTGPTGSGKSSTLAAIIDLINQQQCYHILTIEDPIEFLHSHKNCIVHQRELHSDTPSFALALRAALRQAPKVILVGEMRGQGDHRDRPGSGGNRPPRYVDLAYDRRCPAGQPEGQPDPKKPTDSARSSWGLELRKQ
jgi:twitching motility protein PilT